MRFNGYDTAECHLLLASRRQLSKHLRVMFGRQVHAASRLMRAWLAGLPVEPGGRLPSERAMARDLDLKHYAVNRVIAILVAEGLVERRGYKLFLRQGHEQIQAKRASCDLVISQDDVLRLSSCQKTARDLDVDLRVHSWRVVNESLSQLRALKIGEIESVMIAAPWGEEVASWQSEIARLVQARIPVVCVGRQVAGVSSVVSDDSGAMQLIFERLWDLGHRELAFVSQPLWIPNASEKNAEWRRLCQQFNLDRSSERLVLPNSPRLLKEDSMEIARRLSAEWKDVTALVVLNITDLPIQQLLDALRRQGIEIPSRLTVVSTRDFPRLHFSVPAVGATAFDIHLFHEIAFTLIQRALRKKRELGILPPPSEIWVLPHLIERESIAANPGASDQVPEKRPNARGAAPPSAFMPLPKDDHSIEALRHQAYDFVRDQPASQFHMVDLAAQVNRPLKFRRGWLGDYPLTQLEPGHQVFHGVPFQILGGKRRSDCGAIVLKSQKNKMGNGQALPIRVRIAIESPAAAIYLLHGCGHAKYLTRFATYTFFAGKHQVAEVPMVALGRPPPGARAEEIAQANIQDWWHDYLPCDVPQSRAAPLADPKHLDASAPHVCLYTMEWINPEPARKITHLEITSESVQSTTLGVLAISILRPR